MVKTAEVKKLSDIDTPIGPSDTMLIGHALAADAIMVTHNAREFSRAPDLRIEKWALSADS